MSAETNGLAESTGVSNPLTLLQAMVDKGVDPQALRQMMDLSERWEANQSRKAFQLAMTNAQRDMQAVVKDKENKHTHSMYAALESVQEMARPVYTRHGFSLSFGQEPPPKEGWLRFVCTVRHQDGHSERFQGDYPQDGFGAKGGANMNAVQGVVSSGSYMQRDMLRLIFNLTIAGADQDGNLIAVRVGPEEIKALNGLLEDCRNAGLAVDHAKFLKWLTPRGQAEPMESLEFLLLKDFSKAVAFCTQRLREAKKKEAT